MLAKVLISFFALLGFSAAADVLSDVSARFPLQAGNYSLAGGSIDCLEGPLEIFAVEGGVTYKLGAQPIVTGVALTTVTDQDQGCVTTHQSTFAAGVLSTTMVKKKCDQDKPVTVKTRLTITASGFNYVRTVIQSDQPPVQSRCQLERN